MSLQLARVEQFHEQGHGAADLALALLVAADGPQVLDTQDASKRGLCEPAPLSDGFELVAGHLRGEFANVADDNSLSVAIEEGIAVSCRYAGYKQRKKHASFGAVVERGDTHAVIVQNLSGATEGFLGLKLHFHSPVSGGAAPRCDEAYIGPMVLRCNNNRKHNRTRFVAFLGRRGE